MAKNKTISSEKELRENEKKWGQESLQTGWTMVPSILLEKQHALGLDPIDINLILQIAKHWWRAAEQPFPSQIKLARQMNVDVSTVKRHLHRLRDDGFIDWRQRKRPDGGQTSNVYDLSGLVEHIRQLARDELKARRAEADLRQARRRRKPKRATSAQPKLTLVQGEDTDD